MLNVVESINLAPTLGILLLAVIAAGCLWGVSFIQTYLYFVKFTKDQAHLKLIVAWLLLLDTTHQVMLVIGIYIMAIQRFGELSLIDQFPQAFVWRIFLLVLIEITARCFFTYRIWMFSAKNIIFPLILVPTIAAIAATNMSIFIEGLSHAQTGQDGLGSHFVQRMAYISNGLSCALDIAFAAIMVYLLQKHEIPGMRGSTAIIHRLTLLSIMSGTWTAVVSLVVLINLSIYPESCIWAALTFLLGPLYCNTVIANLNVRTYVRGDTVANAEMVFNLSALQAVKNENPQLDNGSSGTQSDSNKLMRSDRDVTDNCLV